MYEITGSTKIDFNASGKDAYLQCARFLLSTILNSCPMSRDIGWVPPLDDGTDPTKTKTAAQIIDMFAKFLPEITVEDITFEINYETGKVSPKVKVVIEDAQI